MSTTSTDQGHATGRGLHSDDPPGTDGADWTGTSEASRATAGDETESATQGARGDLLTLPWREIIRFALLGVLGVLCLVGLDVARHGGSNPISLIQPGSVGPTVALIHHDFPEVVPPTGLGLDGQQYYAMARNPLHPDEVAPSLDRPRYRWQRPLLPWLAWMLHPSGGGTGLIYALLAVGVALVFAGAVATGVLATTLGGKPWLAALLPLLPGTYWSLRVTVADAPALALAMVALALSARRRPLLAVLVGTLAVLAKEPIILVFVGWALSRPDSLHTPKLARSGSTSEHQRANFGGRMGRFDPGRIAMVVLPACVAGAWMLWLRVILPAGSETVSEVTLPPFGGLVRATSTLWIHGQELVGMVCSVAALLLGAIALWRRRGHALWWPIAILVAFASVMSRDVIGMNFGGTRSNQALLLLAVLALATKSSAVAEPVPEAGADRPVRSGGG